MVEFKLVLISGPRVGESFSLVPGKLQTAGRASAAEIRLKGRHVSRAHAQFGWEGSTPTVTDLGSHNGTAVDMQRIAANTTTPLREGQVVQIAEHCLLVDCVKPLSVSDETSGYAPNLASRYRIGERLGAGSQATVWAAWDTKRKRDVAVKILSGISSYDGEEEERFVREGKICCRLRNPHLVKVYEVAIPRHEPPYLVMELIKGPNAWQLCKLESLSVQKALRLGIHLARALVAIGEAGIVHRDVKPSNLLVTEGGVGKLTDFGIAKVFGGATLTGTGWGMGSLPFAAPEQNSDARGVDARADVYGLGATLYALLAGHPPFVGDPSKPDGLRDLIRQIDNEPPPPLRPKRPDLPPGLGEFVENTLLAKDRDARPAGAREALGRLELIYKGLYASQEDPPSKSETSSIGRNR